MKTHPTIIQHGALAICLIIGFTLISNNRALAQGDYATDPHLTEAVKAFLKPLNVPGPGLETLPVAQGRKVLVDAQAAVKIDYSRVEESEKTIMADGHSIKLNMMRPKGSKAKLPVFIFIHGGGWVLGDFPTHRRMVRDLVELTGFEAIFVNYTPSPEVKYPVAINEIYAAAKWINTHGSELNVYGDKLGIVGNSVGGNMSTVVPLMAAAAGKQIFKVSVLMWPVTNAAFDNYSWDTYGQQRFLTKPLMSWMWDNYTTDPKQRKEIFASPLQATAEQLKGLPPTLVLTDENDILRDEGEEYGRHLDAAGVVTSTIRFNGVIHDFGLLNGLAEIPQTKEMFQQSALFLTKYLK